MPAIMTHDFFGKDALDVVSRLLGFSTTDERDAFLLGNQGPDPFFYLVADPLARSSNLVGNLMHSSRPARLLATMREACDRVAGCDQPIARAYLAGFLCRYLLDREVHPFVFSTQWSICDAGVDGLDRSAGSRVHEEIERDLDEMVLFTKLGVSVAEYRPYEEVLHGSPEVLGVAGRMVSRANLFTYAVETDEWAFGEAVRLFRLVQRVFYSPKGTVRDTLGGLERQLLGANYSLVAAMSHRVRRETTSIFDNRAHNAWTNPFTGEVRHESFWDLFDNALAKVEPAEQILFSQGFGEQAAVRLTRGLNFSGEPVEP